MRRNNTPPPPRGILYIKVSLPKHYSGKMLHVGEHVHRQILLFCIFVYIFVEDGDGDVYLYMHLYMPRTQ